MMTENTDIAAMEARVDPSDQLTTRIKNLQVLGNAKIYNLIDGLGISMGSTNTTPLLSLDGTISPGWVGAAATGLLSISSNGALVADATLLRLTSSGQPAAANDGICLEIVETGLAQATSYAMRITSTNNEALHVDAGKVLVDETLQAVGGLATLVSVADVTNPPTNAEALAAIAAASRIEGGLYVIDDNNAGTDAYLLVYVNGKFWQLTLTACA